jgi:hypothetical protein
VVSTTQTFKPRQLKSVSFDGGRYFRYEALPVDHAAETQVDRLTRGYRANIRTDSILAEVLVDGTATLFRVGTHGSTHFLIKSPDQPVLDLAERSYIRQNNKGSWVVANGNNYQGQLQLYFRSCPAAARSAQRAPFTVEGLAVVVQAYNETCSSVRTIGLDRTPVAKPRRQVAFQGGIMAGLRYNKIPDRLSNECLDCVLRPNAGLYAEVLLPGRRTAFYGELSLGGFSNQGKYVAETIYDRQSNPTYIYGRYKYRALMGVARLGIRYFFPMPHEQQFLIGLSYEQNALWNIKATHSIGPTPTIYEDDFTKPITLLIPIVELGWRVQRMTLTADAHYIIGRAVVRGSVAFRLSRNKDEPR